MKKKQAMGLELVCSDMMWTNHSVCVLSGFLLGNLPEEHFSHLNMGSITKGDALHNFGFL